MDVLNTVLKPRIEIRPDVIHIHTKVYNVITHRVLNRVRGYSVLITGEDFDAVIIPPPLPQPGGLDASFTTSGGATIRDADFRSLLTGPFFVTKGVEARTTVRSILMRHTITGDGIAHITKYSSLPHPTVSGDAEVTNIEVV